MIFLNGRLVSRDEAAIDPADRGLLLGDGLFETLRCEAGAAVGLDAHLARMSEGAAALAIPFSKDNEDLANAIPMLLKANDLDRGAAALRITLTRGPGPRGLLPPESPRSTLMMTAAPLAVLDRPATACIATIRRNEHSPTSRHKTLGYLDNILARREAEAQGKDEAILLNTAGRLACATAANLFLVRGRSLFTPPASEGVLAGITRADAINRGSDLDLTVIETPLEKNMITTCDEIFLTNSLMGVRPLVSVDGKAIGDGRPGPVTEAVGAALKP